MRSEMYIDSDIVAKLRMSENKIVTRLHTVSPSLSVSMP